MVARSAESLWRPGRFGTRIVLVKATGGAQTAAVGAQANGHALFFLQTDDFERDCRIFTVNGVRSAEPSRRE